MSLVFNPFTGNFDVVNDAGFTAEAGQAIRAGAFVGVSAMGKVVHADRLGVAAIGYAPSAAGSGLQVRVLPEGRLTGLTGLTTGQRYFLGADGAPTLSQSSSGQLHQILGRAADSTTLVVQLSDPILRA